MTTQLPLFEGIAPNGTRVVVSGSLDSENYPSTGRPLHLGDEVTFIARGQVRQVNHAVQGKENDHVERRHVIVITSLRFDEGGGLDADDAAWEAGDDG
jgi:hypothetical protein